jgi:hypothetical protein
MRSILRTKGVGPDALPPTPAPERPKDWLDEILDGPDPDPAEDEGAADAGPEPPDEPAAAKPKKPKAKKKRRKRAAPRDPAVPRSAWDSDLPSPRQSLLDAWDNIPHRIKWLAYHAAAAYLGWMVGLVDWATYVTAWIAGTSLLGVQACLWYAAATATVLLHRRTRGWWWPVAWLAAIPVSSTVVGVLLYGTGYHS